MLYLVLNLRNNLSNGVQRCWDLTQSNAHCKSAEQRLNPHLTLACECGTAARVHLVSSQSRVRQLITKFSYFKKSSRFPFNSFESGAWILMGIHLKFTKMFENQKRIYVFSGLRCKLKRCQAIKFVRCAVRFLVAL